MYKCRLKNCSKSFYDRGNLKYHQVKYHPSEVKEFPITCIHSNCNYKYRNENEKLIHHYQTSSNCYEDTSNLISLFHKLEFTLDRLKFDKTSSNLTLLSNLKGNNKNTIEKLNDKESFHKFSG